MNRSSSFVSSLKWWPLQGHNNQSNSNSSSGGSSAGAGSVGITAAHSAPNTPTTNWPISGSNSASGNHHHTHNKTVTFGSSVAVQKLRESKWFKADEQRIFCAVVECGFIVEVRSSAISSSAAVNGTTTTTTSSNVSDSNSSISCFMGDQDENETPVTSWYGIVLCKTAKDNKPKPETIEIFSVKIRANGTYKMIKMALADIWKHGWELRINNFADKEKLPHNEKDIRSQVSLARKAKQSLWNNNQHFAYWCRYGSRQQDVRRRQMSECVRWGSAGMNAGMLLVLKKQHNNHNINNNNNNTH